jgi:hypothetical protein
MEDLDKLVGKTIKYVNDDSEGYIRVGFIDGTCLEIHSRSTSNNGSDVNWLIVDIMEN